MPDSHQLHSQCFDCQGLAVPVHSLHSQNPISTSQPPSFIPESGVMNTEHSQTTRTHFILLPPGLHPAQSSAEVNTSPNDSALKAVKAASHVVTVVRGAARGANSQHRKPEKIITPSKLIYLSITCKLTESHSILKVFPNANHSVSLLFISAHAQPHHLTKQWVTPNFDFSPWTHHTTRTPHLHRTLPLFWPKFTHFCPILCLHTPWSSHQATAKSFHRVN